MTAFQSVVCMLKGTSTKTGLFSKVLRTALASWMLVTSSPTLFAQSLNSSEPTEHKRQRIMAMMYAVDRGIGTMLEALEKNGQLDNTLIILHRITTGKRGYP